jgi:hypothetical protein
MKKNLLVFMKLNFPPKADPPPAEMQQLYQVEYTSTDYKQALLLKQRRWC